MNDPTFRGYRILEELGRGGMGVVYRAFDEGRGEVVALKTLLHPDPSLLYRLKQEFRTLADLAFPNVVGLYDFVTDDEQSFFTMELVEGSDFLEHVRGRPERLRPALRQLATGLAAIHGAGKLHRDVKPTNVLVATDGRVVLLDFGLAGDVQSDDVRRSTQLDVTGTVAYMAPEQAMGEPSSAASDWYAVGVMLYEALTGRLPFSGGAIDILRSKVEREPPAPRDVEASAPQDLSSLATDLLRREPGQRPTGAEILRRLEDATSGVVSPAPVPAPQVGGPPHGLPRLLLIPLDRRRPAAPRRLEPGAGGVDRRGSGPDAFERTQPLLVRRVQQRLRGDCRRQLSAKRHQSESSASGLRARLGCTRIGSPGIFG